MRKAFSLIELLIVVVIIGVVYSLAVGNFENIAKPQNQKVTLQNLKNFMTQISYEKDIKLLCLNDGRSCELFIDGLPADGFEKTFENLLDNTLEIYWYDPVAGMTEYKNELYFDKNGVEQRVCFSYKIDKNGVGEQIVVLFKEKVYDFSAYTDVVAVYNSLGDFLQAKEELYSKVLR